MSSLEISRQFNAPIERVYQAWSNPEQMQKWFFPGEGMSSKVSADFRVGGTYEVVMHSANEKEVTYKHYGVYKEIEKNRKIKFTWNSPFVVNTMVTLNFQGDEQTTQLTLHHDLFEDEAILQQHDGGWNGCLKQLEHHLSLVMAA